MPFSDMVGEIKAHPKRFLAGAAFSFLPFGALLAGGYASRALKESSAQGKPVLPAWGNWKELAVGGLKLGALLAIYNFPSLVALLVLQSLTAALAGALAPLFGFVFAALALVPALGFYAAWKRLALSGSLRQALDFASVFNQIRQGPFAKRALKLLALAIVLLYLARTFPIYGAGAALASWLILLGSAWALAGQGWPRLDVGTAGKKSGRAGGKLAAALMVLLFLGAAAPLLAHIEPLALNNVQNLYLYADAITVTAPSYWQYYWLDPKNLELRTRVNEEEHNHGLQTHAFNLGNASSTTYESWCDLTITQAFPPETAEIYTHPQCHTLDNPTRGCFYLHEVGFGTTGEFLLSIVKQAVAQGMKALTGQFTPAGIAVDLVLNQVGNLLNWLLGLSGHAARPTGPTLGETTGACLTAALGNDPLGKERGLFKAKEGFKSFLEGRFGLKLNKAGEFLSGIGIGMLTDAITDWLMAQLREAMKGWGWQGEWLLAQGCENLAANMTVPIRQADPNLWQFKGAVETSGATKPTEILCQPIIITPPPTGGEPNPPKRPSKTIDTIPKIPGGDTTGKPPIVDTPPLKPPVIDNPPKPECESDTDCARLDKLSCDGLIATMTLGQCAHGACAPDTRTKSCDDNNPKTEDKCEVVGNTAYCRHKPLCGNAQKDSGENCSNCPADVKCDSGQYCEAGVCKEPPCKDHGGDTDKDGACNDQDNCPDIPNDQADKDGDGIGDVCDESPINCSGWAGEIGKESYKSGWTTPGTADAAKSYCGSDMWSGVDKPVCNTTCLKVTINAYITPSNAYVCCARAVTRLPCTDCPGQHPTCPSCGEGYDSGIGGGPVIPG